MDRHPVVQLASEEVSQESVDQIAWLSSLTISEGAYAASWVIETLHDPQMTVAVVMREAAVVAVGVMGSEDGVAYLQVLAVHPDHRRQRLASAILDWLEAHAAASGAEDSFVQCLSSDETALGLYGGRGYRRMVFKEAIAYEGESGVMLRKAVGPSVRESGAEGRA